MKARRVEIETALALTLGKKRSVGLIGKNIKIFFSKEGLDYEEFLVNCRKKKLKNAEYAEVLKKLEFIFNCGDERDEMEIRGSIYKMVEEIERR